MSTQDREPQGTPNAGRVQIGLFGAVNAGKSTLFNALIGQSVSIVAENAGTTTDPVGKAAELIGYGPVMLYDTAGLDDTTELGSARIDAAMRLLRRCDCVLFVEDISTQGAQLEKEKERLSGVSLVIHVFNTRGKKVSEKLLRKYPDALFIDAKSAQDADEVKRTLACRLLPLRLFEQPMLEGLLHEGAGIVGVMPIDSAAPKGRLILPQAQLVREALDFNMHITCTQVAQLAAVLEKLQDTELVITDSQTFREVAELVPNGMPLTSFSILQARKKGELSEFVNGARAVEELKPGARILMSEACTHSSTHEDIGRVKIPQALEKRAGGALTFDYAVGYDFPEDLSNYDLIVHCGGCMIARREMLARQKRAREQGVPMTNYGVLLAQLNGILPRTLEIFK